MTRSLEATQNDKRGYLQAEILPLLERGLEELQRQLEKQQYDLIAGAQWDQDGRMPHSWQPFSSLRWLAEWLRLNNPNASAEALHHVADLASKPFHVLSRKEKAALLFLHYNKQHIRLLNRSEAVTLTRSLGIPDEGGATPAAPSPGDGGDSSPVVDIYDFAALVADMTQHQTDAEFDAALLPALAAWSLGHCSSTQQKLACVFNHLDLDHSGGLTIPEIATLALALDPQASEQQLGASMAYLDLDSSQTVGVDEFTTMLFPLVDSIRDQQLQDAKLALMMSTTTRATMPGEGAAAEVRPRQLANLVRGLPTHKVVPQYKASVLMAQLQAQPSATAPSCVVLVDARSPQEREVSQIPSALPLDVTPDPSAPNGWALQTPAQLEAVRALWQARTADWQAGALAVEYTRPASRQAAVEEKLEGGFPRGATRPTGSRGGARELGSRPGSGRPDGRGAGSVATGSMSLVAYCSYGLRGAAAAVLLAEELQAPAQNLCGGIINYYNNHGTLTTPSGTPVLALHPGSPHLARYITRVNTWH